MKPQAETGGLVAIMKLPLESPLWTELECDVGSAEPVAGTLREAQDILETSKGDRASIDTAVKLAFSVTSRIYHQQTTYSATSAAVPHLLAFAEVANLDDKTLILAMIGHMDFESADQHCLTGLQDAYSTAVASAQDLAIQMLKNLSLNESQQENLFDAVASIRRECTYTIRNQGLIYFCCENCDGELNVDWIDGHYCVTQQNGEVVASLTPTNDIQSEIEQPKNRALAFFYRIAVTGGQQAFLNWLSFLLGSFQCPYCETEQQVNHRSQ